jgi:hypothetical protein
MTLGYASRRLPDAARQPVVARVAFGDEPQHLGRGVGADVFRCVRHFVGHKTG